ncbi:MAG: hypothetical protein ACLTMP_04325 [Eggerthella lenta]
MSAPSSLRASRGFGRGLAGRAAAPGAFRRDVGAGHRPHRADEPTTYSTSAPATRRWSWCAACEEAGKTIVMVIHDLDLALRYSDRLLVMERGRAAAAGTVEEVLATGAIERAFGVSIRPHEAAEGRAYTLFPA